MSVKTELPSKPVTVPDELPSAKPLADLIRGPPGSFADGYRRRSRDARTASAAPGAGRGPLVLPVALQLAARRLPQPGPVTALADLGAAARRQPRRLGDPG